MLKNIIRQLKMNQKKSVKDDIKEIDSLEELIQIDKSYENK